MIKILDKLKNQMKNQFNIYDDYKVDNYNFDFMGEYILTNSKYFLTKDKVVWGYENREYVFVKSLPQISNEYINNEIIPFSNVAMEKVVNPNKEHMSTHITLFLSSENINKDLKNQIKRYKNRRSYKFGFNGFSSLRVILFNPSTKELFYNREAKDVINFYKEVLR